MPRVRALEGWRAGFIARMLQTMVRFAVGSEINPIKVQAHFTRGMLASFISNAFLEAGKAKVGDDLKELVKLRAAALNGCPF